MAQYMATIKGAKGGVSRLGNKVSGMTARVNGWTCGVRVTAEFDKDTGRDVFTVTLTDGSAGGGKYRNLGRFTQDDLVSIDE